MRNFTPFFCAIRKICAQAEDFLPLHAPVFQGNERAYVFDCLDTTYVSSVGAYVDRFETMLRDITGARHAVACVNGTAALHVALHVAGVKRGDMVLTQALSFVATANAISHCGAEPVFLDIDDDTLGLSPQCLADFLEQHCTYARGVCRHKATGKRVAACVPMHTFGLSCRIEKIVDICNKYGVPVVEDAAEALGSTCAGKHCGTFGLLGTLSFNGNKIVTTGGGGAILTNDKHIARIVKHLTTTAKIPHAWEFRHDAVAWNYRMPNINAALGCAQLEQLGHFLKIKRQRAIAYKEYFSTTDWQFIEELPNTQSNYWLCAVLTHNRAVRDAFLQASNAQGIMTRPAWEPLHTLPMYAGCAHSALQVTVCVADRLVNLPNGV